MVAGRCQPGFDGVRDAFASCFAELGETGAALACGVDEELVVDLHGGWADDERVRPWTRDTLVCVWSVTKPFAALAVVLLADRGRVELDERVAAYWPEFAAAGKEGTTVRHLLAHQAGLVGIAATLDLDTLLEPDALAARLAAAPPDWPPGERHGEHALLYGSLLGELVRRVDGRTLGRFLRDEVAAPWGLDFHVGLTQEAFSRVADVVDDGDWSAAMAASPFAPALAAQAGVLDLATVNSARWRRAELAAVNGHATAVALVRLYAGLAAGGALDGMRLLSPAAVGELLSPQAAGRDELLDRHVTWGLGPQLEDDGSFGLGGVGGSSAYGRRSPRRASFAYVTNRMADHARAERCEHAFEHALRGVGR